MKKLFTVVFVLSAFIAQAQFTAGRLVVTRVGDGSAALGSGTAPVSLVEYTTAGVAGTTVNLGSSTAGSRLTTAGTTAYEGQLNLSQDGNFLSLAGYDVPSGEVATNTGVSAIAISAGGTGYTFSSVITISGGGGTGATAVVSNVTSGAISGIRITNTGSGYTSNPTVSISIGSGFTAGTITRVAYWQGITSKKVIARVNSAGTVDYSTNFSNSTGSSGSIKQAVSKDGTKFWVGSNRLEYVAFGQTTDAIQTVNASPRSVGLFKDQVYYVLGFSAAGLSSTNTALPEASSLTTSLLPMDATNSTSVGFVFFDTNSSVGDSKGFDVLYIAEPTAGLEKYYYSGSAWVPVNSRRLPTSLPLNNCVFPTTAFSAMTGTLVAGKPTLYLISGSGGATNNSIYSIVDNGAYNATMVLNTNVTATNLVSAGANYGFRGVSFSPQTNVVLAVELTDLKAKANKTTTLVTWTTASEKNNATFHIEQSTNGTDFQNIGQVKGNGTTNAASNYTFEHLTPSVGVNYYRLKQVDFDGTATYSAVRSVVFGNKVLIVKPTLVQDALSIVVGNENATTVNVFNVSGQQVLTAKIQGEQQLDVSHLPSGLYMIRTETGAVGRFVKQ